MNILVIDVGSSSVRSALVDETGTITGQRQVAFSQARSEGGQVELSAEEIFHLSMTTARSCLEIDPHPRGLAITNQRATSLIWEAASGRALGPVIGWQDLRTLGRCLELKGSGIRLAPNVSATKIEYLLDSFDPDRKRRDLMAGTIDSWLMYRLTGQHITDKTNAGITGLTNPDAGDYNHELLEVLRINETQLPKITAGVLEEHPTATDFGDLPVLAISGDQQASMAGQGTTIEGSAKLTLGTGGMLDMCRGHQPPVSAIRYPEGTFPIVAWSTSSETMWGQEAAMLAAGSCVDWLVTDLQIAHSPAEVQALALSVHDSDGVFFVPALMGLGTPHWDFGARGAVIGATRGTTSAHLARAVLEGVAYRAAELLMAAEVDSGQKVSTLHLDGGMSQNPIVSQTLANAIGRPVEVSDQLEATASGVGMLAWVAARVYDSPTQLAAIARPTQSVEPSGSSQFEKWAKARKRTQEWIPALSTVDF